MSIIGDIKKASRNVVANAYAIRRENDLTVAEFAKATGLSPATIRRIETSRRIHIPRSMAGYVPSLSTVIKLAEAIDAQPADIINGRL